MDDEKLIQSVREYTELYDLSHPKYTDGNYKQKAWKKISEKINQPVSSCKARWNNIRDNYRRSRKKRSTKSGQSASKISKYKYEDHLTFLNSFMKERDNISNVQLDNIEEKENSDVDEPTGQIIEKCSENKNELSEESGISKKAFSYKIKIPAKQNTTASATSTLMDYTIKKNKEKETEIKEVHPVDAFLNGIAPTLKSLKPYSLNIAKTKIFAIVQEIELNEILEREKQCQVSAP